MRVSHRFHAHSGIGHLAKAVNGGNEAEAQTAFNGFSDVHFEVLNEHEQYYWQQDAWKQHIKQGFKEYIDVLKQNLDPDKKAIAIFAAYDTFQVLVALRKGPYGVEQVNQHILRLLREQGAFGAGVSSNYGTEDRQGYCNYDCNLG